MQMLSLTYLTGAEVNSRLRLLLLSVAKNPNRLLGINQHRAQLHCIKNATCHITQAGLAQTHALKNMVMRILWPLEVLNGTWIRSCHFPHNPGGFPNPTS